MHGSFEYADGGDGAGRAVVKHQWQPGRGPADAHDEATALRQLNVLNFVRPAILAATTSARYDAATA